VTPRKLNYVTSGISRLYNLLGGELILHLDTGMEDIRT
jgi:hypothetical protein